VPGRFWLNPKGCGLFEIFPRCSSVAARSGDAHSSRLEKSQRYSQQMRRFSCYRLLGFSRRGPISCASQRFCWCLPSGCCTAGRTRLWLGCVSGVQSLLEHNWNLLKKVLPSFQRSLDKCRQFNLSPPVSFEVEESLDALSSKFARVSDIYTQQVIKSLLYFLLILKPVPAGRLQFRFRRFGQTCQRVEHAAIHTPGRAAQYPAQRSQGCSSHKSKPASSTAKSR
jgi:hypothetical protein